MACIAKASERGGLQRNNHSTADGLYRKQHPNEEACTLTITQTQMACTSKRIRTRRPATQQPLSHRLFLPQKGIRTRRPATHNHLPADDQYRKKTSERGSLHRNTHPTADGLYSKMYPNEEACNATTTQPQMACIAKCIRTRSPAMRQPVNCRWPVLQKASERGGLQRNNHSTADGLYRKKHPNKEACNATITQPQMACTSKSIRTKMPATQQPLN